MDTFSTWAAALRGHWHSLLPDPVWRAFAATVVLASFYFVFVMVAERIAGTRTAHYRSRGFLHDLAYYFYAKGGLPKVALPTMFIVAFNDTFAFLDLGLLVGLPYAVQFIAWLLIADLLQYWLHRAKHHFRFLWAFHTTHHSQEHVTFATYARAHPVEELIGHVLHLFTMLLLGADPVSFFVIYLALDAVGHLSHTQIPWRFGPLYRIVVTPAFHAHHHSRNPEHFDSNFAAFFSFWDYLFGTAVREDSPKPTQFGLDEVKPTSLLDTLTRPFVLLYRYYAPRPRSSPKPVAE